MLTKDELLSKGISPEIADEIIAGFSDDTPDDSLQALQKAITDDPDMDILEKAGGNADPEKDEGDEDYNEEYMKKYMTRYMKENKKACSEAAEKAGLFSEKMNKAVEELNLDTEGGVIEMTDLKPFLGEITEVVDGLSKAIAVVADQVLTIADQNEKSYDLLKKAGKVTAEQAVAMSEFLSTPQGRKGVTADIKMQKAGDIQGTITPDQNKEIYRVLMKAVKEKDANAGIIISSFESAGHNANRLNPSHKKYIQELLQKEGK